MFSFFTFYEAFCFLKIFANIIFMFWILTRYLGIMLHIREISGNFESTFQILFQTLHILYNLEKLKDGLYLTGFS